MMTFPHQCLRGMGWSPDLHPQPPGSLVMLTLGTQAPALRVTVEALLGVGGQH